MVMQSVPTQLLYFALFSVSLLSISGGNENALDDFFQEIFQQAVRELVNVTGTDCALKGVAFDSQEVETKVFQCLDESKVNWQEAKKDRQRTPSPLSIEVRTMKDLIVIVMKSITCLQMYDKLTQQCKNPEGVTIFSIAKAFTKYDALEILPAFGAQEKCSSSTNDFSERFASCFQRKKHPTDHRMGHLCHVLSGIRECTKESEQDLPWCEESLNHFEEFMEKVKASASDREALELCILKQQA